jgi:hypothetical protein
MTIILTTRAILQITLAVSSCMKAIIPVIEMCLPTANHNFQEHRLICKEKAVPKSSYNSMTK